MNYGVYTRAKHERGVSGDAYTVQKDGNKILLALVDGLGSGEEAAKAATAAIAAIQKNHTLPLTEILQHCHLALRATRGVVLGMLRVNLETNRMRYVGVGNVGIRILSQEPFHPISYNGIVGYRLPRVHEFVGKYYQGDLVVLYSDGIDSRFHSDEVLLYGEQDPETLAEAIAMRYGKDDDICVLVAR
jgi:negative regulator of sigma-B (phosphoserine phosphatase)